QRRPIKSQLQTTVERAKRNKYTSCDDGLVASLPTSSATSGCAEVPRRLAIDGFFRDRCSPTTIGIVQLSQDEAGGLLAKTFSICGQEDVFRRRTDAPQDEVLDQQEQDASYRVEPVARSD